MIRQNALPRTAKLLASQLAGPPPAFAANKAKPIIKEMAVSFINIPQSLVKLIKEGDILQAKFSEGDVGKAAAAMRMVSDFRFLNPAKFSKMGHEPVERVGVRWFLLLHKKTNKLS